MNVAFTAEAWQDYLYWQQHDKAILKRINALLKESLRTPFAGSGKPEALKHGLQGCWSRRINREHRLVYRVHDEEILVVSVRFHYG